MSVECQVNVKSQSQLDIGIGGRETCLSCLFPSEMTTTFPAFISLLASASDGHTPEGDF